MSLQKKTLRALAFLLCLAVLAAASSACSRAKRTTDDSRSAKAPVVAVSILPQTYFVSRIAGSRVEVICLVGPGQSPHSYDPSPKQMAALSRARLWLTVGVDFEKGLKPKVAALYPKMNLADTSVGVRYRILEAHRHEGEGAADPDALGGPDQHIWLGREATKIQAANIRDALSALDPDGSPEYAANCRALIADIDSAFEELKTQLEPLKGSRVFVFHPSFGYFMDEFGIRQEAVETGGKEPTQKELAALIAEARADGAKAIFVQKQFPARAAKTVADAIGGRVTEVDPLAGDWLDNLKRMASALRGAR
jgi:zinc transport system substrate-binding protein